MSILRKLASETFIYGLSNVFGRMLNYLLVPFYTSVFIPSEYGIVTELYAYLAFLNVFYIYGLETSYFRFSSQKEPHRYFNIAFTSIFVSSWLFSGSIWFFSESIAQILSYPDKVYVIEYLAAILAIDAIVAIPFARLRQIGKAKRFALLKLSNIGFNILCNLFFLLFCPIILEDNPESFLAYIYNPEFGVAYVFLSNLIANGLYLLFFIPDWIKVRLAFNFSEWKRMMKYAWPILMIGFTGTINEMLSRIILKHRLPEGFYEGYTNLEILGIFGACYKLSVFMTLTIQAFRYAFEPFFFAQAKKKNSSQTFSQIMTWFVLFTSLSWLTLCVFLPYYAPIFLRQQSYLMALEVVPWLLGGGLFLGIFYNLSLWYKLTDLTVYGAYISLFGASITFILNWSLIPIIGYMGSAIATFMSYFLMTIISYLWGTKYYPVPYRLIKIVRCLVFAAGGIFIDKITPLSIWKSLLIVSIFLLISFLLEKKSLMQLKST